MSTQEWFRPTREDKSPFDISYIEEFELSPERTAQELESLSHIISTMFQKPRTLDIAGGFGRIGSELCQVPDFLDSHPLSFFSWCHFEN